MTDEIERVVGAERVGREHLPQLRYGRMVLDEMLRLYPAGWMIPRTAVADDVLGGVRIKAGGTVLVSPYVTQRMSTFWDRPGALRPGAVRAGAAPAALPLLLLPVRRGPAPVPRAVPVPAGGAAHRQHRAQPLPLPAARAGRPHASDGRLAATQAARRGHPHPGRSVRPHRDGDPAVRLGPVRTRSPSRAGCARSPCAAYATCRTSPPPTLSCSTPRRSTRRCSARWPQPSPSSRPGTPPRNCGSPPVPCSGSSPPTGRSTTWPGPCDDVRQVVERLPCGGRRRGARRRATTSARLLADLRDELATVPAFARLRPIWRDEWPRMLPPMAREWDWKNLPTDPTTGRRLPDLDRYLDNADNSGSSLRQRHPLDSHRRREDPRPVDRPAGRRTRRAAGAAAGQRPRHARSGTPSWGDLNALSLVDDPAQVHDRLAELTARSRGDLAALAERCPRQADYLNRQISFTGGFYQLSDFWGERDE